MEGTAWFMEFSFVSIEASLVYRELMVWFIRIVCFESLR